MSEGSIESLSRARAARDGENEAIRAEMRVNHLMARALWRERGVKIDPRVEKLRENGENGTPCDR